MANGPTPIALPLPALLSQALVAFTIEYDNEFERQMPHRTTRHGSTGGLRRPPWLVSMPMWANCMRLVPQDGIQAGELTRRAQLTGKSMQTVLKRMSSWWGYLTIEPGASAARSALLVRPTSAGEQAQAVWEPLAGLIEQRWQERSGRDEIERLRASLLAIVSQFEVEMPGYLPGGEARLGPRSQETADGTGWDSTLPALMSKVLLASALDFEDESDLSMGIYTSARGSRLAVSANILRVLNEEGVRVQDIPGLTGVAKMAIDNWLGSLDEHRYATVGADPAGSRFKVARLTARGRQAQDAYRRWAEGAEQRWAERFGEEPIRSLHACVDRLGGAVALLQAMQPYPEGWRAQIRALTTLPHYPVVSHRGGFPDGS